MKSAITSLIKDYSLPFKTDVFNAKDSQGNEVGHLILNNSVITSINCSMVENAAYTITIKDLQTVKDISDAESKVDELNAKLDDKSIVIEGNGFSNSVKQWLIQVGLKIAGLFS